MLIGRAAGGRTVVAIEGKVNEPFGETLDKYRAQVVRLLERNPRSKAKERLSTLAWALAGWKPSHVDDERQKLRYQLFSAAAGTIAAATDAGAGVAVFCVHELETPHSDPLARQRNTADLEHFMRLVYPYAVRREATNGWVAGPVRVVNASTRLSAGVGLYVAKVTTVAASHPTGPPPVS